MVKDPANPAAEEDDESACTPERVVVKKMANLLVRPKATFVSLVGHAANGLPFTIVKNEDGTAQILNPSTPVMPKEIPVFGSANASLQRLEFDKSVFKTEADVTAYLKKSNISFSKINSTDTHFVIPGVHESSLDNIEAVKGDVDGVTYWIGKLKANLATVKPPSPQASTTVVTKPAATILNPAAVIKGEGDDATKVNLRGDDGQPEEENAHERVFKSEAAPELGVVVKKMDSYIARQIGSQTVDQTLATGDPEIPGLYEIMSAVRVTVQNIVAKSSPADFSAKIQAAFARGGEIAAGLAGIFVSVAKSETDPTKESLVLDRGLIVKHFSSPSSEAAPVATGEGVVSKSEPAEGAPAAVAAPADTTLATQIAEVLKAELAPVKETLQTIGTTVESVQKSATTLETRIVELEGQSTVRKSLPDDGTVAPVEPTATQKEAEVRKAERTQREEAERKKDEEFARRNSRSQLGMVTP